MAVRRHRSRDHRPWRSRRQARVRAMAAGAGRAKTRDPASPRPAQPVVVESSAPIAIIVLIGAGPVGALGRHGRGGDGGTGTFAGAMASKPAAPPACAGAQAQAPSAGRTGAARSVGAEARHRSDLDRRLHRLDHRLANWPDSGRGTLGAAALTGAGAWANVVGAATAGRGASTRKGARRQHLAHAIEQRGRVNGFFTCPSARAAARLVQRLARPREQDHRHVRQRRLALERHTGRSRSSREREVREDGSGVSARARGPVGSRRWSGGSPTLEVSANTRCIVTLSSATRMVRHRRWPPKRCGSTLPSRSVKEALPSGPDSAD